MKFRNQVFVLLGTLCFGLLNFGISHGAKGIISLELVNSYSGSLVLTPTDMQLVNGTYQTKTKTLSFIVQADVSSNYAISGDLQLSGSGTGTYGHYYSLTYTGDKETISFFASFTNEDGEVLITPNIKVLFLSEKPQTTEPIHKFSGGGGNLGVPPLQTTPQQENTQKEHGSPEYISLGCQIDPIWYRNPLDPEWINAYGYAIKLGLFPEQKNFCDIVEVPTLSRLQTAHMMSTFAQTVVKKPETLNKEACSQFSELSGYNQKDRQAMVKICQLGIMGLHSDGKKPKADFEPETLLTRAEFGTIISRTFFPGKYTPTKNEIWYQSHLEGLNKEGIMKKITHPMGKERYLWALLVLYRMRAVEVQTSP